MKLKLIYTTGEDYHTTLGVATDDKNVKKIKREAYFDMSTELVGLLGRNLTFSEKSLIAKSIKVEDIEANDFLSIDTLFSI